MFTKFTNMMVLIVLGSVFSYTKDWGLISHLTNQSPRYAFMSNENYQLSRCWGYWTTFTFGTDPN